MSRPDVRVLIVAFGHAELLASTLSALGGGFDVLVVDNSSDREVEAVVSRHGATYVDPGRNGGFAAGVNLGLTATLIGDERHVLLLNPDAVIQPDDVHMLLEALQGPGAERVAALSPSLIGMDGALQRVMWPFPHPMRAWLEALGLGRLNRAEEFAVGTVLLLRAEAVRDIGGFDERFFLYAEETDWQRRAAARGWAVRHVADVVVSHVGGGTSSDPARREQLFHAGTETYVRKWFGRSGWGTYRAAAWTGARLRGALLPRARGASARARAELYRRGPRRAAGFETT